ncbi:hypothetical protein GOP47_0009506 [Adiantum capillus-veneris]|uniref:Sugar phosphate transporter domain-containing protein n=1 Tax=Adiantum capillus-veneris TaxID=13818 RepID=A0A9D4ZJQ6_ADICA|nr:hypothetical protein GOP47_0009506 [Adiantum capillus-veneris]
MKLAKDCRAGKNPMATMHEMAYRADHCSIAVRRFPPCITCRFQSGHSTMAVARKRAHCVRMKKALLLGAPLPCKQGSHPGRVHHLSTCVNVKAYNEAGKPDSLHEKPYDATYEPEVEDEHATHSQIRRNIKIGLYFTAWWTFNVIFNIYNKKVLNVFPYPWFTSMLSLATGSLIMIAAWITGIVEPPNVDWDFWKALTPVALAHTVGHVAATVSMSRVAVSFTHIIKSAEPAFSVFVSRLLGERFPLSVYLSLIPIIGGCALAALTELNFDMTGFMGAMISNLAFVIRNICSKQAMKGKKVKGINYYGCLTILSLAFLAPFAFAMEGPKLWKEGWSRAIQTVGPNFKWWVLAQSVFYHLYNQVSYMSLQEISPLTFSIGNTMKRVSVIVSSIIIFHIPVRPINAMGAAIAILGTFLYSQAKQ